MAALVLFLVTAAVVVWQNSRLGILWDLSYYILENSYRISIGQVPEQRAQSPVVLLPTTDKVTDKISSTLPMTNGLLARVMAWRLRDLAIWLARRSAGNANTWLLRLNDSVMLRRIVTLPVPTGERTRSREIGQQRSGGANVFEKSPGSRGPSGSETGGEARSASPRDQTGQGRFGDKAASV
jgi:hypothetical protein